MISAFPRNRLPFYMKITRVALRWQMPVNLPPVLGILIKYHALCEWVERDLLVHERVPTAKNMSDHFTKNLSKILFHRHVDFIMGHVPPPHSPLFGQLLCLHPTPTPVPDLDHPPAAAAAKIVAIYRCYANRDLFPIQGIW